MKSAAWMCAGLLLCGSWPGLAQEETVIEGFLVRRSDGTIEVTEEVYPLPDRVVRPLRVLDAGLARRFEGVELHDAPGSAWSREASEGRGPLCRVRVRAVVARKAPKRTSILDPGVDSVTIQEILETEFLSRAWLEGRVEARDRLGKLWQALEGEAPSQDKRGRCLDLARAVLDGVEAASKSWEPKPPSAPPSGGSRTDRWRKGMERQFRRELRERCLPFDLWPPEAPVVPTAGELRALFLEAKNAEALRAALLPFGAEVMDDVVLWAEIGYEYAKVSDLVGWDRERFAANQSRAKAWMTQDEAERRSRMRTFAEAERPLQRAGLRVSVEVPHELRVRAVFTGGVVAERVEAKSRAERAGLQAGDVIWRVQGDYWGKGARRFVFVEEVSLSRILEMAEKDGTASLMLDVIRAGECRELALPMR